MRSHAATDLVVDVTGYVSTAPPTLPDYEHEPGWHLEPPSLMFTEVDRVATVRLVHYDAAGEPSGSAVPAGTRLIRSDSAFDVDTIAPGEYRISGGSVIGTELMAVEVPGSATSRSLWVTSTRLQPGVQVVDPDRIVLPPPAGTDTDSVAPFTVEELKARTVVDPDGVTAFPYVLTGAPPIVGSLVVTGGANEAFGRVIELPGLPTLQRQGLSLVTLELVPLDTIFAELDVDVDFEQLSNAGVLPDLGGVTCVNVEPEDATDCDEIISIASDQRPTRFRGGPEVFGGVGEALSNSCQTDIAFKVGENKVKFNRDFRPLGGFQIAAAGGELRALQFTAGIFLDVSASVEGKLLSTLGLGFECLLYEFPVPDIPIPPPLGAVVTALIEPGVAIATELELGGGPGYEYKAGCSASAEATAGVRYVPGTGLVPLSQKKEPTLECEKSLAPIEGGFDGLGPVVAAELKPWLYLQSTVGVRVGGKAAEFFGRIFDVDDLGEFEPFIGKVGPRIDMATENQARTVEQKESSTSALARVVATLGFNDEAFSGVFAMLLGGPVDLALPEVEFGRTLDNPLVESGTPGPARVTVDGVEVTEVDVDDQVEVVVEVAAKDPPPVFASSFADTIDTYRQAAGSGDWAATDLWTWTTSGNTATARMTVDADACDELGNSGRPFVAVAGMSAVAGLFPYPQYLGEFSLRCDRGITLDPESIELTRVVPDATVTVSHESRAGETWAFEPVEALPDGYVVVVDPPTGTFVADESVDVDFSLTCGEDADDTAGASMQLLSDGESTGAAGTLVIDLDCRDDVLSIVEEEVVAGAEFTVRTEGSSTTEWTAVGWSDPDQGGTLEPTDSPETFTVRAAADDRAQGVIPARCGGTPGLLALARETRTAGVESPDRGSATVTVILPAKEGRDPVHKRCKRRPAISRGEPHLGTFDGVGYSPMVVGEYVYAETDDGSTRVVGRFDSYKPSETGLPGWLTVNISLAVEAEGHVIEHHRRPDLRVIIDGVDVPTTSGTYRLSGGVDVTVSGGRLTVTTPELTMESYPGRCRGCGNYEPFFDLSLDVDEATPMRGLFGSNNDDTTDEFLVRGTGEYLTLEVVREHDTDMYRFTDSWRITDLDDSPFTVPHPVFDQPNRPAAASEFLEPFRVEARALLAQLGARCSSETADTYTVNVIALELAIGREPSDLTEFGCSYLIRGEVQVDPFALGASGSTVLVTSPGFAPCEAVVGASGDYTCELVPDLDADDPELPFVVDVVVDGTTSATTVQFDTVAGYAQTATEVANLSIGATDTRVLALHGVITEYGEVVRTTETLRVLAADSSGATVVDIAQPLQLDPVSGAFPGDDGRVYVVVPPDVDEVVARTQSGAEVSLIDLVAGVNDRSVVLDATPRRLDLTGTMRYNGGAPLELRTMLEQVRPGGNRYGRVNIELEPDGSYQQYVYLDDTATSATLSTTLGSRRSEPVTFEVPDTPAVTYPLAVSYDVTMDAPVLDISGAFASSGQRIPTRVTLRVDDGVSPFDVSVAVVGGSFTTSAHLASGATAAEVTALLGSPTNPSVSVDGLANGPNPVSFPIDLTAPVVLLTGTIERNGLPYSGPATLTFGPNVGPNLTRSVAVVDGAYEIAVELGQDVTSASVVASVGEYQPAFPTTELTGLVPGVNEPTWHFGFEMIDLQISGILLDDGVVPSGDARIAVSGRDAAGVHVDLNAGPTSERTATVTLDENGRYGTTISVPINVASVAISRVVPEALDRVYVRLTGLEPGSHLVGLDDDYRPSVAQPVGTITRGGEPIAAGAYTVRATGTSQGSFGPRSFDTTGNAVVDASGTIFTTSNVVVPRSAEVYDIVLEAGPVPSAHRTAGIASAEITGGIIPVDFSGDLGGDVIVDLTAELVDDNGLVTADTVLELELLDVDGAVIGNETVTATAGPERLTVARLHYPRDVEAIRVTWDPGGGSDEQSEVYDLVAGVNTVAFVAAASSVLQVWGTMTVNGAPTGQYFGIRVTFITPEGEVEVPSDVDRDNATGEYALTAVGPSDSTAARLDFLVGEPDDREPVVIDGLTPGLNTVVDLDYDQDETRLRLAGTLTERGVLSTQGRFVTMVATDAGSNVVATDDVYLSLEPDGSFVRDLTLPADAVSATFTLSSGPSGNTHAVTHTTAAVHGTTTESTWPIVVSSVLLRGIVSNDGVPAPDRRLAFDWVTSDGGAPVESGTFELTTDENGGYEQEIFLPVGADEIVVTPQFPAPAATVALTTPGFTDATDTDFDQTTIAPDFTIDGEFFDLTGLGQTPTFAVRAVQLAGFDGLVDAGAAVTHSRIEPDGSTFVVEGTFTTAPEVLVLDVTFPVSGVTYNLGFDVAELALPMSLSLYDVFPSGILDHDESWITLTGTAYSTGTGCPWPEGPLVFDTTLTARHPDGDIPAVTTAVVPDLSDGTFALTVPLSWPLDSFEIGTRYDSGSYYNAFSIAVGGGITIAERYPFVVGDNVFDSEAWVACAI